MEYLCSCSAYVTRVYWDLSEKFIHQLSSVLCCETKGAAFASGASCFILGPWNVVSISGH
jgi:hypothetical protein